MKRTSDELIDATSPTGRLTAARRERAEQEAAMRPPPPPVPELTEAEQRLSPAAKMAIVRERMAAQDAAREAERQAALERQRQATTTTEENA